MRYHVLLLPSPKFPEDQKIAPWFVVLKRADQAELLSSYANTVKGLTRAFRAWRDDQEKAKKAKRNEDKNKGKDSQRAVKRFDAKHVDEYIDEAFYLFDSASMERLFAKLAPGDAIVLHAEGNPAVIGLDAASPWDLRPCTLATLLQQRGLPGDIEINIDLLICNSATDYPCRYPYQNADDQVEGLVFRRFNFAQDTSRALACLGYKRVSVTGYTGKVVEKESAGEYYVGVLDEGDDSDPKKPGGRSNPKEGKGTHASLHDACAVYRGWDLVSPSKMTLIEDGRVLGSFIVAYCLRTVEDEKDSRFKPIAQAAAAAAGVGAAAAAQAAGAGSASILPPASVDRVMPFIASSKPKAGAAGDSAAGDSAAGDSASDGEGSPIGGER